MKSNFDGPIPGENYTSDTRNYPWHRPPDEADFNKLVGKMVKSLQDPEIMSVMLAALEDGDTILDFVVGSLRVAIGRGKMSIDHAVLVAGPFAKMAETVAKRAGIKYELGFDTKPKIVTKAKADMYRGKFPMQKKPEPVEEAPAPEKPASGLMGKPTADPKTEQDKMLGWGKE